MTFRDRPTVDSPLADLIAGKINQAEYQRRLLERRLGDPPTRPTVQLDEWRNANPARWRLDPDPLTVEPEPVVPLTDRPVPVRWAWFGLGVCVGVIVAFLVIAFAIGPAPSTGQTTDPVDLSGTSFAALCGAPLDPAFVLAARLADVRLVGAP